MHNADSRYTTTAELELSENGVFVSNTIGHSMEPFLSHHRDVVVIVRPERELRRLDVVLYPSREGYYILHRIIAVRGDTLVIRGDNTYVKEYVPRSAVIGVLESYTRDGKHGEISSFGFRLYSGFWTFIYPLRALSRKLRIGLSRLYRKILPKKKH